MSFDWQDIKPHDMKTRVAKDTQPSMELLQGLHGKRVLDFGCGYGRNLAFLAKESFCTGYDYPNFIQVAKNFLGTLSERVNFIEVGEALGDYDVAIACFVFQHMRSLELDAMLFCLSKHVKELRVLDKDFMDGSPHPHDGTLVHILSYFKPVRIESVVYDGKYHYLGVFVPI